LLSTPERLRNFWWLDQVDIRLFIVVPDDHDPTMEEEPVMESPELNQGWRKPQFLQSAAHGFS
jgi:hypothetical protein